VDIGCVPRLPYQPKNNEERIGKDKKIEVRKEYLEIHRRARREEERRSFCLL
jgi:hypothetical protein